MQPLPLSARNRGSIALLTAVCFLPLILGLAVVADGSRTWIARERLQNGVEASATAVAKKWASTGTACGVAEMAYISADGATASSQHCTTTGTSKSGTVVIDASGTVDLFFGNLLGRAHSHISSSTGVRLGAPHSMIGLWPFALCANVPEVAAWLTSQLTSTASYTITFESQKPACSGGASGNWGAIDFNGGSNSTSETNTWITSGYSAPVVVGSLLAGNPGVPSSSLNIASAIGKTFLFALYDTATGSGNNANFHVVGFATAKLISARLTGGNAQRSLTIQFLRDSESGVIGSGITNYGVTAWTVCSQDAQGACQ